MATSRGYYDSARTGRATRLKLRLNFADIKGVGAELPRGSILHRGNENYSAYEKTLPLACQEKAEDYVTIRLTKMLMYQTMRLSSYHIFAVDRAIS